MIPSPAITKIPSSISYHLILLLLNKGSKKAVNKEVVAIPAKHMLIFEIWAEAKKVIQCAPTINPVAMNIIIALGLNIIFRPNIIKKTKSATAASKVL